MDCVWLLLLLTPLIYFLHRYYRRDFIQDFYTKYVFITGCDSGFGHKLAVDLDSLGLNVYAGCFTTAGADKLKAQCSKRLKTIHVDVTDQSSVDRAKQFILDDLPQGKFLWGLVNNAGIVGNVSFELSTMEDYHQLMEVNFFGCIRVAQAFAPLIKRSRGRMVQTASMFGRGCCSTAAYTASKYAIEPYTDELRRYMRQFRVKVSTIEPGFYPTTGLMDDSLVTQIMKRRYDALPDTKKAELGKDYLDDEITFFRHSFESFPLAKYNDPSFVTEAMTHALGAKHPKARYLVGYDARAYVIFTNWFPDWFVDGFLRFANWKIRREALAAKKHN